MEEALQAAGLHEASAKTYLALLQIEQITPIALSKLTSESRSNTYKLLDELIGMELAERFDINKKLHYRAKSPTHLATLAKDRLDNIKSQEKQINSQLPSLLKTYYKNHEQPGIRFYQGKEGIEEIYKEQITVGQPIQFWQTREDKNFFGFDFMHKIRIMAPGAGICRKVFAPDAPEVPINYKTNENETLLERTWYEPNEYTAPVEWSVYGDKTSIISFGQEAVGMVIDSQQIAESLRQLFGLLDTGLKRNPDYDKMPLRKELKDVDSFIKQHKNKVPKIKN